MNKMFSTIKTEREKIYYHLTHSLSNLITLEFDECDLCLRSYTDTMMSFSRHSFYAIHEDNYPLNNYLIIEDTEHLKFLKSLLKRKKATIGFKLEADGIYLCYDYDTYEKELKLLDNNEQKIVKRKVNKSGTLLLGRALEEKDLPDNARLAITYVERESVFSADYGEVYQKLLTEAHVDITKFEFEVISLDSILVNKRDVIKMLNVFEKNINFLYFSYEPNTKIVSFDSPESFLTIYSTAVSRYN